MSNCHKLGCFVVLFVGLAICVYLTVTTEIGRALLSATRDGSLSFVNSLARAQQPRLQPHNSYAFTGKPSLSATFIIPVYAPIGDGNHVPAYIAVVEQAVATWQAGKMEGELWMQYL